MRILFYFIHPAKFHAFRSVINKLIENGVTVDVAIIKKDILEELVSSEGWNYTNIFPEGRRIKGVHTYISAAINLFRTLHRLNKFAKNKHYDLCITDDLFTILGRIKRIPTIFFTDDDLTAVPESVILIATSKYIFAPAVSYMGRYEKKKIGYYGYKSLAHLHPNRFNPDRGLLDESLRSCEKYFFIRCVSVTSTHDVGKKGISDALLLKMVTFLKKYGRVILNSERELPAGLKEYVLNINKSDIAHYLAFAQIFISDSTTMCAEAAVLGTPSLEIDDWYPDFKQYKDFNEKYGLLSGFKPDDEKNIFALLEELVKDPDLKEKYKEKKEKLLNNSVDVSAFLYWILSEYPSSINTFFQNKDVQLRFK